MSGQVRNGRPGGGGRPLVTIEQAAVLLGLGRSTLYRAVDAGRVPFAVHRIGGVRYVSRASIRRLLEGAPGSWASEANSISDEDEQVPASHPIRLRCARRRADPRPR